MSLAHLRLSQAGPLPPGSQVWRLGSLGRERWGEKGQVEAFRGPARAPLEKRNTPGEFKEDQPCPGSRISDSGSPDRAIDCCVAAGQHPNLSAPHFLSRPVKKSAHSRRVIVSMNEAGGRWLEDSAHAHMARLRKWVSYRAPVVRGVQASGRWARRHKGRSGGAFDFPPRRLALGYTEPES